jgi:hypothetical protein
LIKTGFYARSSRLQGSEYEESDSGYSDPSPDGGAAQARSGETGNQSSSEEDEPNNNTTADRKSVFSELSYEDDENDESSSHYQQHDIFPTVIIKNQEGDELEQRSSSSPSLRQYGRQRSVFQTPGKDILTSLVSRDDLAVIGQESVDARTTASPKQHRHSSPKEQRHRHSSPHKCGRPAVYDETYRRSVPSGRRPTQEAVPGRHLAKQCEEKPEKNGCFYVMTALDFCWCL